MKLVDLNHVRAVPRLESPEAAKLPGELNKIRAYTTAVADGVNILNDAIENESSMDANRRENESKRVYQRDVTEATQEFHSDPDASPEKYVERLNEIRESSFSSASEGASGRTLKYLNPRLDNLRTQYQPVELQLATKAVESKQFMHLQMQGELSAEAVTRDGRSLESQLGIMNSEIDKMTTLSVGQRKDLSNKAVVDLSTRAVSTMAADRDLEGVSEFLESPMFFDLSLDQQETVRGMATKLSAEAVEEDTQELRNRMARGEVSFDSALDYVLSLNEAMPGASDAVKETSRREIESSLAKSYLGGLAARDEWHTLQSALDSGKFDAYLDPAATVQFTGAVASGLKAKTAAAMVSNAYDVNNAVHGALLGNPVAQNVFASLEETLANPDLTPTQRAAAENQKAHLDIAQDVQPIVASIPTVSSADLETMLADAVREASAPRDANNQAYTQAWSAVANQAQAALTERAKDPAGYAYANDVPTRTAWDKTTEAFTRATQSKDPEQVKKNVIEAQASYTAYKTASIAAFTQYNPAYANMPQATVRVPDTTFTRNFASGLAVQDRAAQMATIRQMQAVFKDDTYKIASVLTDENPALGGAVMATLYNNPQLSEWFLNGQQRMQGEGYKVTTTKILDTAMESSIRIPTDAAGNYGSAGIEMMEALIASRDTAANLQSNEPAPEVIEWARDEVFGVPFRINAYGGEALPFRDRVTGRMVDSSDIRRRFRTLERGWGDVESSGMPAVYFNTPDGLVKTTYREIAPWITPVLAKTPGAYQLDIRSDNGMQARGFISDKDGNPLALDIMAVPPVAPYTDDPLNHTPIRN